MINTHCWRLQSQGGGTLDILENIQHYRVPLLMFYLFKQQYRAQTSLFRATEAQESQGSALPCSGTFHY